MCFASLNLCCLPRPPEPHCLATGYPDTPGPHGRHCTYLRHQGRSDLSRHTRQHASLPAVCGIRNARLLKTHPWTFTGCCLGSWGTSCLATGQLRKRCARIAGWRPKTAYVCVFQQNNGWQFLGYVAISIIALSAGCYVTNAPSAPNPITEIATVLFPKGIAVRISPCVRGGAAVCGHTRTHARKADTPSHHATPMADGASCGRECGISATMP